jgi:very-short-patch-repair endonuclease
MDLTEGARTLRKKQTDAERKLWSKLRRKGLGCKFRRQVPLGPCIVDFVCFEKKLVVEVDGGQHAGMERDIARGSWLCDQGFEVLRFWDSDVLKNPEGVVHAIAAELERRVVARRAIATA